MNIVKRLRNSIIGRSDDGGAKAGSPKQEQKAGGNFEDDEYAMDRYSRQIGAYGVEAMSKLVKMKVLVIGVKGIGVEVAKNLVLAGPGAVTIVDDRTVALQDLGTNFFAREGDVGKKTLAEASLDELKSLNSLVNVQLHSGKITEKLVASHTVVVDCMLDMTESIKWNDFCRKQSSSIGFVRAMNHGLSGYVFTDFGDKFSVRDKTGEPPVTRNIETIDTSKPNQLHVKLIPPPDGRMHNIADDDHEGWVSFEEVPGTLGSMINNQGAFRIKDATRKNAKGKDVYDPYSFYVELPNRGKLPEHTEKGGSFTQVKQPVDITSRSLAANILQPVDPSEGMLLFTDGSKFGRAEQLHIAFAGLWEYEKVNKKMPPANDDAAMEEVLKYAMAFNDEGKKSDDAFSVEEVDADVVKNVARFAGLTFQPLCCFFGGVVAQEVVKLTGKFTPLRQWLQIDCFEVMPEEQSEDGAVPVEEKQPVGSRYDDLIQILGRPLHTKLLKSKTFMVGCGALGCELLKNLALLGVACDPEGDGLVTVTDNDNIEVSNLSRQFLFREENVGQSKSMAASSRVVGMNKDFKVKALETLVEPRTENVFNQEFWSSQDWITNALDNVKARQYVDTKCVFYEKPLLESGTLGTKCNAQVVIPHLTCSYNDGPQDNDNGDAIPMCTLRNFPSRAEHCIEWARAQFNDMFTADATKATNFIENPQEWLADLKEKTVDGTPSAVGAAVGKEIDSLKAVHRFLMQGTSGAVDFESCVKEAFNIFHVRYRDTINSLIKLYPEDFVDEDGEVFWSGTKRFPQSATFDTNNKLHMDYIISAANIFAVNFGVQSASVPVPKNDKKRDPKYVAKIIEGLEIPTPAKQKVDMSGGGEDAAKSKVEEDDSALIEEFEALLSDLEKLAEDKEKLQAVRVEPADFEKDDDKNFHIDFITASSNLRAWNYRMKEIKRHKAKMIAGKIIPAIATTTAAVTGLVCIELLKVIQPGKKIEAFKDSSNSLGINGYFFSEPSPPVKAKDEYDIYELSDVVCKPQGFTKWDKTLIKGGDLTLQEFINAFKDLTELNLTSVAYARDEAQNIGSSETIYSTDGDDEEEDRIYSERLEKPMLTLLEEMYGSSVTKHKNYVGLECSTANDDGDLFKVPQLIYQFKE